MTQAVLVGRVFRTHTVEQKEVSEYATNQEVPRGTVGTSCAAQLWKHAPVSELPRGSAAQSPADDTREAIVRALLWMPRVWPPVAHGAASMGRHPRIPDPALVGSHHGRAARTARLV